VAEPVYNLVTYTPANGPRVFLTLEGEFVMRVGVEPTINRATIPFDQYALIEPHLYKAGRVEFWFTRDPRQTARTPDHFFDGISVAYVEPVLRGSLRDAPGSRVIDYTIYLVDSRADFAHPFGGRLIDGMVNVDATEDGAPTTSATMSNSAMITACAKRIGLKANVPNDVDSVPPLANRRWYGAHAPTELAALLEHTGCVLVPNPTLLDIQRAGSGSVPSVPGARTESDVANTFKSRRGTTLIISSTPSATVDLVKLVGPTSGTFRFVLQDSKGVWRAIDSQEITTDYWTGSTAQEQARKDFSGVGETYRDRVRAQAFRCIQLDPATYDPLVQRILRRRVEAHDGTGATLILKEIQVSAKRLIRNAQGLYVNSKERVRCQARYIAAGNILVVSEVIGTIEGNGTVVDPLPKFVAPAADDVELQLSIEAAVKSPEDQSRLVPEYAHFGYTIGPNGNVVALGKDEAAAEALNPGPDTVFLDRPELRRVRDSINNKDNYNDLAAIAGSIAQRYFAGVTTQSRTIVATGFFPIALSGRTVEVRYNQSQLRTTIVIDALDGALIPRSKPSQGFYKFGKGDGDKQSDPTALGVAGGGVQPVVALVGSEPPTPAARREYTMKITALAPLASGSGNPTRWSYSGAEQRKKGAGNASGAVWEDVPDGKTGPMYNLTETLNDTAGLMGSGVTLAAGGVIQDTQIKLQPAPVGTRVRCWEETITPPSSGGGGSTSSTTELWFQYENATDGACS
jgi:hypothetical protein